MDRLATALLKTSYLDASQVREALGDVEKIEVIVPKRAKEQGSQRNAGLGVEEDAEGWSEPCTMETNHDQ